jgi:L-lactate dehydrogenase complex protein LldE
MRVALFIPCYVDQLRPEVGLASLDVLEALGIETVFPEDQTCCGQPFLTAGETEGARELGRRHARIFEGYDAVVTPSGSCAATLRQHLPRLVPEASATEVAGRTRELCEFLVEQGALARLRGRLGPVAGRVGLHASCHALRELRLGSPSETREPPRPDPARRLLECVEGLELVDPARRDECCGFGGVFAVAEEAVSCRMGLDRLADHRSAGARIVTSTDISCLLHMEGLARRRGLPIRTLHVAEILAASLGAAQGASESSALENGGQRGTR